MTAVCECVGGEGKEEEKGRGGGGVGLVGEREIGRNERREES